VLSADHGESFGEHRSRSHGTTLYDEVLRVPLLIGGPGVRPGSIDDLVSLVDLAPTMLDLFDVEAPGHFMGQSLKPYILGERPVLTRPIVAEARDLIAFVSPKGLKVILDVKTERTELYDLETDPFELDNIADDDARLRDPLSYLYAFRDAHRLRRKGYQVPTIR
jgi:arylsulfatase A-like enzyme